MLGSRASACSPAGKFRLNWVLWAERTRCSHSYMLIYKSHKGMRWWNKWEKQVPSGEEREREQSLPTHVTQGT